LASKDYEKWMRKNVFFGSLIDLVLPLGVNLEYVGL